MRIIVYIRIISYKHVTQTQKKNNKIIFFPRNEVKCVCVKFVFRLQCLEFEFVLGLIDINLKMEISKKIFLFIVHNIRYLMHSVIDLLSQEIVQLDYDIPNAFVHLFVFEYLHPWFSSILNKENRENNKNSKSFHFTCPLKKCFQCI